MKGVVLDSSTYDRGDINTSNLYTQLSNWQQYPYTMSTDIKARIREANVLVTNKVEIDRAQIEQATELKLILAAATGTDHIDLAACREKQIAVCNVRDYATSSVVQHTIGLMLALTTSLVHYHTDVRNGKWPSSNIFCLLDHPIQDLNGKVLGVIGWGNLGKRVASVSEALGMEILICQRVGGITQPGRVGLSTLLKESDIITLHCPLTPSTHHLITARQFEKMKSTAFLINTARGAIVNSTDLAEALRLGRISGAGIDVADKEPPDLSHPLLGEGIPNLILTPHTAWASRESRQNLLNGLSINLKAWLEGQPINVVNQ